MHPSPRRSGFTLIEMVVALALTLIVSGAIYGLLSVGQSGFKREPEISDMQQNLRMAMDVIARDLEAAGEGIPAGPSAGNPPGMPFVQVFSPGLENVAGRPVRPSSVEGSANEDRTDDLSFLVGSSDCGAEQVCGYDKGQSASNIRTVSGSTCLKSGDTAIFFMADGTWTTRFLTDVKPDNNSGALGNCDSKTKHSSVDFNPGHGGGGGGSPSNPNNPSPADLCAAQPELGTTTGGSCNPTYVMRADLVSYRVTKGTDGVPNLERRSARALGSTLMADGFQVIARGIEDLQVQYVRAGRSGVFLPDPKTTGEDTDGAPRITGSEDERYDRIVTRVRVTLAGRTNAGGLAGQTIDATGRADSSLPLGRQFIRSSLTSTAAVRAGLLQLAQRYGGQPPPKPLAWQQ